jgi:zinc/manganese transport system substrate-binding protein
MKITKISRIFAGALLVGGLIVSKPALAATDIIASIPELGAIAKAVGGDSVRVYSIAKPNQDYHSIETRPSDVARISKADLIVRSGRSLDSWMDSLMNAAGNSRLNRGGSGYVDASQNIPVIEAPTGSISGASGDVHPHGNPHYYYDPIYAKFVAQNILRGLVRVDAKNADKYRSNFTSFNKAIDSKMVGWNQKLRPFAGKPIVTYHRSYNYFLRRFGIRQYATLEPKPGIPPTAKHISGLVANIKRDKVRGIIAESIYPKRFADLITRETGAKYEIAPYSVASITEEGYFGLIDTLVNKTKSALD